MRELILILNVLTFIYSIIRTILFGYPGYYETAVIVSMPILFFLNEWLVTNE